VVDSIAQNTIDMARTILIPTDFSISSLNLVRYAIERNPDDTLNIVFVTGISLSESITDLLFFSKKEIIENLENNDFREACQIIRNRYQSVISSMRTALFTGFTQAAFSNFLEGNQIDEIYLPQNNNLEYKGRTFNPVPFMERSNLPKRSIRLDEKAGVSAKNTLAELFINLI
jgi:hypothetical protein